MPTYSWQVSWTGVEGYMESTASGGPLQESMPGVDQRPKPLVLPEDTVLGVSQVYLYSRSQGFPANERKFRSAAASSGAYP